MPLFRRTYTTDEQIVKGCLKNHSLAQKALFEKYQTKLLGVCYRYCSNTTDAEEVLQLSFVKIFEKIGKFRNEGSFEGWLRKIVVYTALDYVRAKKDFLLEDDFELEVEDSNFEVEGEMDKEIILNLLNDLPEGYRLILNLYSIEGYSHKEIAQTLAISEGTSKSQLSKARKHFLKLLNANKIYARG